MDKTLKCVVDLNEKNEKNNEKILKEEERKTDKFEKQQEMIGRKIDKFDKDQEKNTKKTEKTEKSEESQEINDKKQGKNKEIFAKKGSNIIEKQAEKKKIDIPPPKTQLVVNTGKTLPKAEKEIRKSSLETEVEEKNKIQQEKVAKLMNYKYEEKENNRGFWSRSWRFFFLFSDQLQK